MDDEEALPECEPADVAMSLRWERSDGALRGEIVAVNTGGRTCRLSNKPGVQPLGIDGEPLPTEHLITMELRMPPYVVLRPGGRARAPVSWSSWRGEPASARAVVEWPGGWATVEVRGPHQPDRTDDAQNLSSSWFDLID